MDLATAVEKTIAYGKYFIFPLSAEEIYFWLISPEPVTQNQIKKYLQPLSKKDQELKSSLQKNTQQKEKLATKLINIARYIPGIRLIALTGSVAANNSKKNDDIDLLIITAPHTLWLVRPLFLFLLSSKFNRRHPGDDPQNTNNLFCPNLWLDTQSLVISPLRQNIYTAHEVLQIKPLFDRGQTYQRFIFANRWTKHFLANAYQELHQTNVPQTGTNILSYLIAPLNYLFFLLQYLYMLPKKTTEVVSLHSAYFHKNDLSTSLTTYLQNKSL